LLAYRNRTAIVVGGLAALGVAALIALAAAAPSASARGGGCAHATDQPGEATSGQFRDALVCLIQKARHQRGLAKLSENGKLDRIAREHTDVMLAQDCFSHKCSGEPGTKKRLRDAGYLKGDTWRYGEGIGYESTPKKMVNAFLDSKYHRRLMFDDRFEDIGAAAKRGAPKASEDDNDFVTYTFELGTP
jgi:uncharacterized protein YkwD